MLSDFDRLKLSEEMRKKQVDQSHLSEYVTASDSQDIIAWLLRVEPAPNSEWEDSLAEGVHSVRAQYENSVSWKITKPLRLFKLVLRSLSQVGLRATIARATNKYGS